jgi:hypothetical protein
MSALSSSMSGLSSRTTALRVASLITAINVLVAVGFSVAGLVNPKWILPASYVPTEASFIFALYAAARTIPLAVIALVAIYQRSESAILLLGTLAGFIQLLDAGVGLLQHDLGKSIGPLVIAAFQLLAVCLLRGSVRGSVGIVAALGSNGPQKDVPRTSLKIDAVTTRETASAQRRPCCARRVLIAAM